MLVLVGSLFLLLVGIGTMVFRRRLQANFPHVENPTRRDIHAEGYWTAARLGVSNVVGGLVLLVVYFIWFG